MIAPIRVALNRICSAGLLLLILSAASVSAAIAEKREFKIEAQDAATALTEFGRQAGVQILFEYDLVKGHRTNAVSGELEPKEAIRLLVEGTGLQISEMENGVLVVEAGQHPSRKAAANQPYTLAQNDERAQPPQETPSAGASQPTAEPAQRKEQPKSGIQPVDIGEVVVTGTHIRGGAPVGAQLISIDRSEIERTGFATTQEVLRALPQNFGGGPSEDTASPEFGQEANSNAAASSAINLRGLGAGATLVLLNGRRLAPAGVEGTFVDVWSIPLTMIERIDVLPDGASAIYGSDAVGGVVNFVLRTDYQGAETQARFGSVTDGGLEEYQFGQVLGTQWNSGHGLLSYEYYRRASLPASKRELAADSDLRRFGGDNFDDLSNNPGTIVIDSQTWAIPPGQDGSSLTAADLVAGTTNPANRNEGLNLLGEQRRHSVFGAVSQEVGSRVRLFAEGLFGRRDALLQGRGLPIVLTVPSTNPFYVNPAGGTDPITISYNFIDDLGSRKADLEIETYNVASGITLDMRRDWRITAYGKYALEEVKQVQDNIDQTVLTTALADPNPTTAFNPFGDGSFTNPAVLAALRLNSLFTTDSDLWVGNVTADGPILHLPGADARLAIGAEFRQQSFESLNRLPGQFEFTASFDREVTAAFAEVLIPLVGEGNARAGLRRLELSLAGRYEDYSDFGSATNPRVGVVWSPVTGLTLRGTWAESFKAPNLADLNESNNFTFIFPVTDPLSPTGTSDVLLWGGKNADLKEETARSQTLGVDWTPQSVPGFRTGLTYFDIEYEDRIQEAPFTGTWLVEPRFADLVTRDPTPAQRELACSRSTFFGASAEECVDAPISALIDLRALNTALTETSGLDLIAAYEFGSKIGTFNTTLNATYLLDFAVAQERSSPLIDLVDTATNPIDLRLRGSVTWTREGFGATAFINYADGYRDTVSEPDRDVGSWTTVDLQLTYEIRDGEQPLLDDTVFSLNMQNVFDEDPPFFNSPIGIGYDQANADLLGRFISFQIRKSW